MLNSSQTARVLFAIFGILPLSSCADEPSSAPTSKTAEEKAGARASSVQPNQKSVTGKAEKPGTGEKQPAVPKELTVDELAGGWRVIEIIAQDLKVSGDLARTKGAIAEIYPKSIRWSYKPEGAVGLGDFCREPVAGIILKEAAVLKVRQDFKIGFTQLALNKSEIGHPHEWQCGDGGKFGLSDEAGADFVIVNNNAMLVRWHGSALLYLERLDRPSPKADMQTSDYISDH